MNERVFQNNIERLRAPERKERIEVEKVVELLLAKGKIKSVLDIGTGSGLFAEEFFNKGIEVTGVDLQEEMLEAAKSFLPNCEFKLGKAEELPIQEKAVDLAFMGLVFHEVDDHKQALEEAKRVSKIGVGILEWNYLTEEFGPPLEHRVNPDLIKSLIKEVGYSSFEVIKLKNLVLYWFKI